MSIVDLEDYWQSIPIAERAEKNHEVVAFRYYDSTSSLTSSLSGKTRQQIVSGVFNSQY